MDKINHSICVMAINVKKNNKKAHPTMNYTSVTNLMGAEKKKKGKCFNGSEQNAN